MRRRDFIKGIVGSAAWPIAARAQQASHIRLVGVLMNTSDSDSEGQTRIAALRDGLRKLGWIDGRNIEIKSRWPAGDPERARVYAAELVSMNPEVIFAGTTMPLIALQRATKTTPIVFAQIIDPVATGHVASIPHPGGNITGFALFEYTIAAEWVELLKQMAPNVTRIAAIYDPANDEGPGYLPMMEAAARKHAIEVTSYAVRSGAEIQQVIETFAHEPNGGLIPLPGPITVVQRDLILSLTAKHRLPNLYAYRYYPANGGLASYGPDNIDLYRRAADYIDRILKGDRPNDLPVQFPTKYQLIINLKTANTLGLNIPESFLVRADDVIE
jgi:putative ABC transport system substrate-binding protein